MSTKKKRKFYEEHIDSVHTVLWESTNEEGFMTGFTENYVKVQQPFKEEKVNTIEQVILEKIDGNGNVLIG